MTPFNYACAVFATVATITAMLAAWALGDTLRARRLFRAEPVVDPARERYFRFRVQLGIFRVLVQILMILAAIIAIINPMHTGVWLLIVFSIAEAFTSAMAITDIWTRRRSLADAKKGTNK